MMIDTFSSFQLLKEIDPIGQLFLIIVSAGIAIQIIGLIFLIRFKSVRIPELKSSIKLPGVSIIKTCYKLEDNEEEHFDIFFRQDYLGSLQLIFVVSDDLDPVVPLVRKYLAKY